MEASKTNSRPFERIAVAVSFSPRIEGVIAESVRYAKSMDAELIFIHNRQGAEDHTGELEKLITKHTEDYLKHRIMVGEGNVVRALLRITKDYKIDLLIAGALEKESYLKYYLGSVSRKLARHAHCSLLILKDPSVTPQPINKIIVDGRDDERTINTIQTALYLAECKNCTEVYVVRENELSGIATLVNQQYQEETDNLHLQLEREEYRHMESLIKKIDTGTIDVKHMIIEGKPGYEIGNFARSEEADLLVISSHNSRFGILSRFFPSSFEHLLENLPSSLLIVHSDLSSN